MMAICALAVVKLRRLPAVSSSRSRRIGTGTDHASEGPQGHQQARGGRRDGARDMRRRAIQEQQHGQLRRHPRRTGEFVIPFDRLPTR